MGPVKFSILLFCAALLAALPGRPIEEVLDPEITAEELIKHIKFMADDDLEGRAAGSDGALITGEYVAEYFKLIGLEPIGDDGTYYQNFALPRGFEALPSTAVKAEKGRRTAEFEFGKEITVAPSSASGTAKGMAVFAGYGISAPMYGYDDYEDIDAAGKIVIVMRGIPGGQQGPFKNRRAVRTHGTFKAKQDTAAGLGAKGLIIVNDPDNFGSKKKDILESGRSEAQGSIPFIHMTYKASAKLLSGTGVSIGRLQSKIDKGKRPSSREIPELIIELNAGIEPIELKVRNVIGRLKAGAEDKTDEVVAVGAHFDHVGLGEFGSRGGSKARGEVHNGADDNASGTAAVIEIAAYLTMHKKELKRDVIFAAFTAEEMGLHGSKHYVDKPASPIADTVAMVNLDMIGRMVKSKLNIGGVGTSPIFKELIERLNKETVRLKLTLSPGGRAPTDSNSFYLKEIPVLFFNTGLHKDYHLPSDDTKLIDKRGAEKVTLLAAEITRYLATVDDRPPFTRADTGGFQSGPHLGLTVSQRPEGVCVTSVEKKSPASRAGFRNDDMIIEFEDQEIRTSADFYGIKAQCPPGKRVEIVIRRDGRARTLKVKLGK